jgi:single-stranded-DNA-specific exonuclease
VGNDNNHLKLTLSDGWSTWDAIAFRQGDWAGKLPDRIDLVYHLEINEWNSQRRLQLNVQDIRSAGNEDDVARLWLGRDEPGEG